jgi:hypothetical protein
LAFLAEEGIQSTVQGETLSHASGAIPFAETFPTVWVREEDFDRAEAAMARFEAVPKHQPTGTPWKCPACGESIEPQFTECWKCGASRGE